MWNDLLTAGASFLEKLGQAMGDPKAKKGRAKAQAASGLQIETDQATGKRHLKLPLPPKETLEKFGSLLEAFAKQMK